MPKTRPLPAGDIFNREHEDTIRAKRVTLVDGEGDVVTQTIVSEGNLSKAFVVDEGGNQLLFNILKELKKMNLHLSLITDEVVENTEVE